MSNEGKKVKTHYKGTLDDGTQFDSSYDRGEPLEFTCMAGQMIPGFDKAVRDMEVGETKTVRLEPAEAYGEHNPALVQKMPRSNVPNADQLPIGQTIYLRSGSSAPFPARVVEVTDDSVSFDMNHELAGQALTFEITLVEVADWPPHASRARKPRVHPLLRRTRGFLILCSP